MSCCENPLVVVLMGSESDWETMQRTHKTLDDFGVPHVCRVLSAHRTPDLVAAFVKETEAKGAEVFIAGAGLAAGPIAMRWTQSDHILGETVFAAFLPRCPANLL